ncbi:alpha/beta fold hydrolase [Naasia lichenicola]|uniref:alpha/beta fold hydrolase n=1 Tax=Naasia lichenicola TaxID=2565933 RepID=UPI001E4A91A6|nr:alpha/beta hydrolase [Naasia lichenicola]
MLNSADWPYGYYGYTEDNVDTFFAESIPSTGHGTPLWRRGIRLVRLIRAMRSSMDGEKGEKGLTPGELELLGDHAHADWRPVIAGSSVPILFIAGAESEMWPSAHAAASAALTASATSVVIAHDGHATNIEQPRRFNAILLDFLTRF